VCTLEDFRAAAYGLGDHPQDHGWRHLYKLFSYGLDHSAPHLTDIVLAQAKARPALSTTHLLALLGIALKVAAPGSFNSIAVDAPIADRLDNLEDVLSRNRRQILDIIHDRQNSFTSVRRFLVPQVILSSYFSKLDGCEAMFADFGTGLGILPCQLNSRFQYDKFANDLVWPGGVPAFRTIPLKSRIGADKGPYGQSEYYANLYKELVQTISAPDIATTKVRYEELDLLDTEALSAFIHRNNINAVNFSYVLYELERGKRAEILQTLARELHPPGVIIVAEPHRELHGQGAVIEVFHNGDARPYTLCFVSDGHYKGYVIPLDDYETFNHSFPIVYSLRNPEI
jgi:hypothetical protein